MLLSSVMMNIWSVAWKAIWSFAPRHVANVLLLAVLASSCGHQATAAEPQNQQPKKELVPVPLAELSFMHDSLRRRVYRINHIMGGANYPAANTIAWSRRPNSGYKDGRADDFVAQWSTVTNRLGVSIQPGQEPASTVLIYAKVDPKSTELKANPSIWRIYLRGNWRPKAPGWDATVIISTNALEKEVIRVHFRHSDTRTLNLPFEDWVAAMPPNPRLRAGSGFKQTRIGSRRTDLSISQVRALTKSPESFRDEAVRIIAAVEAKMLADILASRGVERGSYRQVDNDGNTQFFASDSKDVEPLSADETKQFRGMVKTEYQRRRSLVQENFAELHAAILRAFPLDQYVADKPIRIAPEDSDH